MRIVEQKRRTVVGKKILILAGLVAAASRPPLCAQDYSKLAFNIGGGISTPLNPTANYIGVSGNFETGAGYNIDKHHSILGEFMWSSMPTNPSVIHRVNAPYGNANLYALTANYRYRHDRLGGSHFGAYLIGGGGWYYRHASVDKNYMVPPYTVCEPIYTSFGYGCDTGGYVYSVTVAYKGVSAGGLNAGAGFTIRLTDSGLKFYVEARYHYAFSRIPSTLVPVTFGFRFI
jgi:hypothetical protein